MIANQTLANLVATLISVLAAFFVTGLIVLALGENPLAVLMIFIETSLLSWDGIGYTIFYMTPLLFTGLSVAIAFKAGLFNIGAEGQLYMGTMATALFAAHYANWPSLILVPACMLVAFIVGGFWGAIPGYLKVRFGSHEVINTIMLNLIAYGICNYLVVGPFKRQGDQLLETDFIGENARIFRLHELMPWISKDIPANSSFLLALVLLLVYLVFFRNIRWGYEMQVSGQSNEVSRYAGINSRRYIILAMFVAGGVAGLVAMHEVLGYRYTFHDNFSRGAGFIGIAVALLGRSNAFGIFVAAFLFGMMSRGGLFLDINFDSLSSDLVVVVQGVVILFVAMSGMIERLIKKT